MLKHFLIALFFLAGFAYARAAVVEGEVPYRADGAKLKGYMAYDDAVAGRRPAVIVVHEWWGLNEYPRNRARMLVESGYVAFAADMYGDAKTVDNPDEAGKLSASVMGNPSGAETRFQAALDLLRNDERVDSDRIAAVGYCFGGTVVLHMARRGMPLNAVISMHGNLDSKLPPPVPGQIKSRIFIAQGGADTIAPLQQFDPFLKQLETAKVDYKAAVYAGALHAFSNPRADEYGQRFKMPVAYNSTADKRSWEDMLAFLKETLK